MAHIGVIGVGSWGTALALLLHDNGHRVEVWDHNAALLKEIDEGRENPKYLPGIKIPSGLKVNYTLAETIAEKDCLLFAVPSHAIRSVLGNLTRVGDEAIIVSVAKGIENDTLLRASQILAEKFPEERIAVLSGPSHAEEVSLGIPTVVVCASKELATAEWVQKAAMNSTFRVYVQNDVTGVEIGAALKNIVAVAAGIIDGVGFGDNTKAALLTRGLAEITRLGIKLGADPLTFAGLSGMGDLIVTCMSKHSRNRYVGEQIGKGKTLQQVLDEMIMVAEGVKTTKSAYDLAMKHDVEVPIINEVYSILFENKNPKQAVFDLMTRAAKFEDWG